jgi:hypothetical protein
MSVDTVACSEECGWASDFVHVLQSRPRSQLLRPSPEACAYALFRCETAGGLAQPAVQQASSLQCETRVIELFNGHRHSCRLHRYLTMISEATSCVDIHFGNYNSTAGLSCQGSH